MAKVVLVYMSMAVRMYILLPFLCFSMVSKATVCPGRKTLKSLGFLKIFWRLAFLILPKWDTLCGDFLKPPQSLISLSMVDELGCFNMPVASQKSKSRGWILSAPRLGCFSLRFFNSSIILTSHNLFLLIIGAWLLELRDSIFPRPCLSLRFQSNKVLLFALKASLVADNPYLSQKANMRALRNACSVIIYRYLIASL